MSLPSMPFRYPPFVAAVLAALIQTVVLGYMVESRATILRNGTEVLLKTVPIDPRDLLRGDYVTLSYQISTIPRSVVSGTVPKTTGRQTMWVRLVPGTDGLWTMKEAAFSELLPEAGSVVVRTLPFQYYAGLDGQIPDSIFVSYGIERYYVPEGEGRVLEHARNAEALEVAAKVSKVGQMQIRQILLDGKPAYEEPLY